MAHGIAQGMPGLAVFALHSTHPFFSQQSLSGGWELPEGGGRLLKPLWLEACTMFRQEGWIFSFSSHLPTLGSPLTALVRKSVLSFGPELKEGSEEGVKNSREGKLSHP